MTWKTMFLNILLTFGFAQQIYSTEVDKGLVIIDNKPWKTSWVKENDKIWVLVAHFEKGELKTYFTKAPPTTGFGLSSENKPIKQELVFHSGKSFTSTVCEFEQWPDGAKAYSFKFDEKFEREGKKLELGTTAIIEEVGSAENEIRYAIFKGTQSESPSLSKKENSNGESKHLNELPIHEQLAHKSLMRKLNLLRIHRDYIQNQKESLLELMTKLEDAKDKNGDMTVKQFTKILNSLEFPKVEKMKPALEKISSDTYLGFKAKNCLELLSEGNNESINKWFELLEEEIRVEIDIYEENDMLFPQYKYVLEFYTDARTSLIGYFQMLRLMNPKIFNSQAIEESSLND